MGARGERTGLALARARRAGCPGRARRACKTSSQARRSLRGPSPPTLGPPLKPTRTTLLLILAATCLVGCRTRRTLIVNSAPEGAVVRLDEEVIGTTPLRHEFTHGGSRRVSIYHPEHRTWSQVVDLGMPWYSRFPMDLLTEVVLPLGLDHEFTVDAPLTPDTREDEGEGPAIAGYLERARALWAEERAAIEAAAAARDDS